MFNGCGDAIYPSASGHRHSKMDGLLMIILVPLQCKHHNKVCKYIHMASTFFRLNSLKKVKDPWFRRKRF